MSRYINADNMKTTKSIQSADFNSIETIQKWIDEQPTADVVERKHGEWIEDEEQNHVELTFHCSECGCEAWGIEETTNFCPECGADMRNILPKP